MNKHLPALSFVNGVASHAVPVSDRGLNYGDGLFETILYLDKQLVLEAAHLARLQRDCARLKIHLDAQTLVRELAQLREAIVQHGATAGVARIVVTRESAGRGYAAPVSAGACRLLQFSPGISYPHTHRDGIRLQLSDYRLPDNAALAGIKHLNRLDQVLAQTALAKPFYQEGLLCDAHGYVVEGTLSNLFIVKDGALRTPTLDRAGVRGVMRDYLLDTVAPQLALDAREARLTVDDVLAADEVFVCNSVFGIWPVIALNVCAFPCGRVTRILQRAVDALGYPQVHRAPGGG